MNWREKQWRFSIRKLKVAVASTVVGLAVFGGHLPSVQANSSVQPIQHQGITYHYVLESELTEAEKQQIITHLPSQEVGQYDTYYMVYRPRVPKGNLPKTGGDSLSSLGLLGAGLLVVGITLSKDRKLSLIHI